MRKHKLLVMTNPIDGQEDEYNNWYNNQHLADVVAVPGFVSAQRFKLTNAIGFEHSHRYVAIYEIESDQPQAVIDELFKRQGTPAMVISEALNLPTASCGLFEACSPVVKAGSTPKQDQEQPKVA